MSAAPQGRLPENVHHFARALRKGGVRLGPQQVEHALTALAATGLGARADVYHALRATLITRAEHLALFDELFALFWRDPDYRGAMLHMLSPTLRDEMPPPPPKPAARRAAEAVGEAPPPRPGPEGEVTRIEAHLTSAPQERLKAMDFEQMSLDEQRAAARALRQLRLDLPPLASRRLSPASHGRHPDLRATLRRTLRGGGELDRLARRAPRRRKPALVALVDISGSMAAYSRLLLQFLHGLAQAPDPAWGPVHGFTFGTRLTNITRALQRRDGDGALAAIGQEAPDWQGGTRIGDALERFNKDWSRRVLGQGAVVLLISDGLERGDPGLLGREAERLGKSCRQLIWLNPLLRYDGFAPEAQGIKALLPHVDRFLPCHNLTSLEGLAALLSRPLDAKPRL